MQNTTAPLQANIHSGTPPPPSKDPETEMDEGEGGGFRLGKKHSDKGAAGAGEVDYKTKAGTAWSHSYLNQKPWHPLSYPNQRRKWIAEQTHANREHRAEEVAREFAQEQEFFRQTALFSQKEKEKVEMMKAVSFMYVRPPGYNAESAKAAEVADERKNLDQNNAGQDSTSASPMTATKPDKNLSGDKKARPKDVFGRSLPTEEEFEVLKNAPRLETGMPARVKPFGVEIRNVRCVRCGTFGHQSGDRECPLKDVIMPNEENRLKRDDPLTAIMAQTDSSEPLKWELKQKPGLSPPRGGFQPDDPNQQIVAEEIFDEYGGFLSGGDIPALLFSTSKSKKHSKHKSKHKHHSTSGPHSEPKHRYRDRSPSSSDSEADRERKRRTKSKHKKKKGHHSESGGANGSDSERHGNRSSSSDSEDERERKRRGKSKRRRKKRYHSESSRSDSSDLEGHGNRSPSSEDDSERKRSTHKHKKRFHLKSSRNYSSDSERHGNRSSSGSEVDRERKRRAKGKSKEQESRHFESSGLVRQYRWRRR